MITRNNKYLFVIFIAVALFSLVSVNLVSAIDLSATFRSEGLNLSINFSDLTMYANGSVFVEATYIGFMNLSRTEGAIETLTFNITEQNKSYTGSDMPYISSSSDDSKTVTSGLDSSLLSKIFISVKDCDEIGTISTSNSQNYYAPSTCSGNFLILSSLNISANSDTVITINYNLQSSEICSGFFDAGNSFISLVIVLIIVSVAGYIIYILMTGDDGGVDVTNMAIAILIAFIAIVIGMRIINTIGSC